MNQQEHTNPFRDASGRSLGYYTLEAEAWDMGYKGAREDIKKDGFKVDDHLFHEDDLIDRIRRLTKPNQPYWVYIVSDIPEKPQD